MMANPDEIEQLLKKQERELTAQFEDRLNKEIANLKERCAFILLNEQIRASYMLREAHRERQEKISALQNQLECKNLAGLMYVMCTERRHSALEKLRMKEEYENYIIELQNILTEAQEVILYLSRGYKTAARVDQEWRDKMTKILKEFQMFIYDFTGGTPETNQYFFDIPRLLSTQAPIVDNPNEDPCEEEKEEPKFEESDKNKTWWERLESDNRPFIMFGDMADFKPPQRREVLRTVKAKKTAPAKWKEYAFNGMYVKAECRNADVIKDEYMNYMPMPEKFECFYGSAERKMSRASMNPDRRGTAASIDLRGNMGSILKIITSNAVGQATNKATLLGARDSMEIASATKLREKHKHPGDTNRVVINIGARRTSMFDECYEPCDDSRTSNEGRSRHEEDKEDTHSYASRAHDSLEVIHRRTPDRDRIHYERVCPMDKCQRLQVDSFIRSLPAYMRANPFTHFEQTFEEYETCTPEQIEILKHRIEQRKKKDKQDLLQPEENPVEEWEVIEGVATQTSELSVSLPPCTCMAPSPTPVSSYGKIYDVKDLFPVKHALDEIHKTCFFDDNIQFNRFRLIGQEDSDNNVKEEKRTTKSRLAEIGKVLKDHPSLLDIFQANTQ